MLLKFLMGLELRPMIKAMREAGSLPSSLELEEMLPSVLVMYCAHKRYSLEFSEQGSITNLNEYDEDPVLGALSHWNGDHPWMKEEYSELADGRVDDFYSGAVRDLVRGAIDDIPKRKDEHQLSKSLKLPVFNRYGWHFLKEVFSRMGFSSIRDTNDNFTLLEFIPSGVDYYVDIQDPAMQALAMVYAECIGFDVSGLHFLNPDSEGLVCDVVALYQTQYWVKFEGITYPRVDLDVVFNAALNTSQKKVCLFVLDEIAHIEESLLRPKKVALESVQDGLWVFDLNKGHDRVRLIGGRIEANPLLEEIIEARGCTYPWVYITPGSFAGLLPEGYRDYPSEALEGAETRRLLDVVDFVDPKQWDMSAPEVIDGVSLWTYRPSASFAELASPFYHGKRVSYQTISRRTWSGRNLHICEGKNSFSFCISRNDGDYCLDDSADEMYTLRPKDDSISLEYLAYLIMMHPFFTYWRPKTRSTRIVEDSLPFIKIPVISDRTVQESIVKGEIERAREVVNSDGIYRVMCVGETATFDEDDRQQIMGWNVLIAGEADSVNGEGGLKAFLDRNGSEADAIIIDPATEASGDRLKGLRKAISLGKEHNVPVFVYSELPYEALEADLDEAELSYCKFIGTGEEDSLRRLVTAVRDGLDSGGALPTQLRARYKREFQAAETVKDLFGEDVPANLLGYLMHPNSSLNDIRKSTETLLRAVIREVSSGNAAACGLSGGSIAKLFQLGVFTDDTYSKKTFKMDGTIMDSTLATSLVFLYVQILNGASHGDGNDNRKLKVDSYIEEIGTANLAMAAIHLYMDFIVWLASTGGEFKASCRVQDGNAPILEGLVRCVGPNEYILETRDPRYAKLHFLPGEKIADGTRVEVFKVIEEKRMPDRYDWFVPKDCWRIP